jgi:nicotinamidase-related amidase
MIEKFGQNTALLVIDAQKGINVLDYWGGAHGRRNNPDAEQRIARLLAAWRVEQRDVFFTQHDSREAESPLKLSLETGQMLEGLEPLPNETVIIKDVNSGFVGTNLEIELRRAGIDRLVVAGYFTNMCIETTVRMAGNMGFDTYLVEDACACTNRVGYDGEDYDPELVHAMTVANLHREFCTAIHLEDALGLLVENSSRLDRVQGND